MGMTHATSKTEQRSPLYGKTILVTRAVRQAKEFSAALRTLGARVVEFPAIQICEPDSWDELDRCMENFSRYDGIIFTSVNAVEYFFSHIDNGIRPVVCKKIICAVGGKTRESLEHHNITAKVVPERYTADELVAALQPLNITGKHFLFPRGSRSRDIIRSGLEKSGAYVDECIVYTTKYTDPESAAAIREILERHGIDMVTFFSPSSVESYFQVMRQIFPEPEALSAAFHRVHTAVIGEVTSDALQKEGVVPTVIPPVSTAEDLIDSIVRFYKPKTT